MIRLKTTLPLAALLGLPMPLAAAEGGWNTLFAVDPGLVVWTLLTFGALLFVLGRYAWKPLLGALEAREQGIQDAIDEANKQRDEAQAVLAEHREQLADARRQAQQIVADSRETADKLRRELEDKAREESGRMLEAARREIGREKDAAIDAVRRESVELAIAAASKLLAERLDGDRDRELVMGYVNELSNGGTGA